MSRATWSLIRTNIGVLVSEQRAEKIEAESLQKRREDKGVDKFLRVVYGALLNLSQGSDLTIWAIFLYPKLARAPKYRHLSGIQDQLDQKADALGIKLMIVVTPFTLKKVSILGTRMCNPEDLTGRIQTFVLGQHTYLQKNSASTATKG